eukprot:gene12116-13247_t
MTHESSSAPLPLQPIKEVSQIPETAQVVASCGTLLVRSST